MSGGAERPNDVKKNVWCYDVTRNKWNKRAMLNCGKFLPPFLPQGVNAAVNKLVNSFQNPQLQ